MVSVDVKHRVYFQTDSVHRQRGIQASNACLYLVSSVSQMDSVHRQRGIQGSNASLYLMSPGVPDRVHRQRGIQGSKACLYL